MAMTNETKGAVVVAAIGTALFTILLACKQLNMGSYVALMVGLGAVSLILHGFSRVTEFDLRNMKVILARIETVKDEIFAKEDDLRFITLQLAKIIAYSNAIQGRFPTKEDAELKKRWFRGRTELILDKLEISQEERQEMDITYALYDEFDKTEDLQEMEKLRKTLRDKILHEIEEMGV